MKRRTIIALLLALCLTLSACAAEKTAEAETAAVPQGVAVQVKTVERQDVATEHRVNGTVTSEEETSVYVAANAKVTAVYFSAGDAVNKGDVICTLDLGSTQASYNAAKISYDSSKASYDQQKELFDKQLQMLQDQIALSEKTLALREKNVEDTKALLAIGAASELELKSAEIELDAARMELDSLNLQVLSTQTQRDSTLAQLRAGMESYRSNLEQLALVMDDVDERGNVVAPADGTLASLSATEGGYVSAGYPVAVISGAEQMKVTAYISEALVAKLSAGDTARVAVTAAEAAYTGAVRSVDRTANPQTGLFAVTIGVPADVTGLLAGMSAEVTFYTETSEGAIAIPSEAILTANGAQYVFVAENGAAKQTPVTTGLTGEGVTEVLSGLSAGQELVVVGQQYLADGDAVRVVSGG